MASPIPGLETRPAGAGVERVGLPSFAPRLTRPSWGVYWRTLRRLRGSQLARLAARRLGRRAPAPGRVRGPVALAKLTRPLLWPEWQPAAAREMLRARRFEFLHQASPASGPI